MLNNRESTLRRALDAEKTIAKKVEAAYVAILSRKPTREESQQWTTLLDTPSPKEPQREQPRKQAPQKGTAPGMTARGDSGLGFVDLVWVLVNSNEFRFIR
jgi:hypothetical protein